MAPRFPGGELAHRGVAMQAIHVGHLLPEVPRGPAHRMNHPIQLGYMAPATGASAWTKQFLQPFVTEHQHRVSLDDQLGLGFFYAPFGQLTGVKQV